MAMKMAEKTAGGSSGGLNQEEESDAKRLEEMDKNSQYEKARANVI